MRVPSLIDQDEIPPPPYTPQSSSSPTEFFATDTTLPIRPSLRGGYIRPTVSSGAPDHASAAAYFEERPCTVQISSDILEHHITVPAGATRESLYFPHPERKYQERDIRVADWYTFVNYLIPDQTESQTEPLTEKAKSADEDPEKRDERIEAVVAEWNEGFFGPRGVLILCDLRPLEAPAYRSLIDLSQDGLSVNSSSQPTPVSVESSKTAKSDRGKTGKHRRSSLSSISSSSSSSSFSSCSVDSFSSDDLVGSDFPLILGTLVSLRHDPARRSNLKASIQQIGKDIRAQRRALPRHERKQWSRELKTELHTQKKAIKTEVKSLIKEAKESHKLERKARKAERKAEHQSRRAERKERRCGRRNPRREAESSIDFAKGAAARAFEAKARAQESSFYAQEKAHEAQALAYERETRNRDVAFERDARMRQLQAQTREMTLEAEADARVGARAREVDARAGERTLSGKATTASGQEMGVVENQG